MKEKKKFNLTTWQILALGYFTVILLGTLLLLLPFATTEGESTSFIDALFTSTSAACVTGLVPYDTNTHWTLFGQIVILCLIQLGGLGFMTFVSVFFTLIGKDMGVSVKKLLMASSGEDRRNQLLRLFKRILLGTLLFEGVGALLLSIRFIGDFGIGKGIYYAIFHSISAFCNAGFDLMGGMYGDSKFVSLTHYATDPLVIVTIALLILIGGLGFCVWDDLLESKFQLKKMRLHTKVVLLMTLALIILPTFSILFFEWKNPTFIDYSFGERLLISFFTAISPRTAGFNAIDLCTLSDSSYLTTIILMFIGGSSGSTAGGVKITTLFIILMGMWSVFRGKQDIEVGNRRVHNALLRQALAVFVSCLFIIVMASLCICTFETSNSAAGLKEVLFETFSAMGTVGLSMGLTPSLSVPSKLILICLMYAGRAGILTLGLAFGEKTHTAEIRKPVDTLLIG
ncbi:MAG: Trk family potassium uptake protein [Clostridia bacterium]|nr:Trk family potassium uptake protein [Clostridia bacterium]